MSGRISSFFTSRFSTNGGAEVQFDAAQPAVTPGQAVTFYAGTRVLGGGWIDRAPPISPRSPL